MATAASNLSRLNCSDRRIAICGVGALGSNLADMLARQGAARLRVIDHDRVESHNIANQIYTLADVGQFKVDALRKQLFRAINIEIEPLRKQLTTENAAKLLSAADVIVDCVDNHAARSAIQQYARQTATVTLHLGLSDNYGEVIWDDAYRVPADAADPTCTNPLARSLVLLTVAVAVETLQHFLVSGERLNHSITLRDLKIVQIQS